MKKSLLAILLFSMAFTMNAQNNDNETKGIFERKHEVRLGAVKLLAGGILEASYEYVFDSNQGLGAHLLINFDSDLKYFENYSLTPYYRMYFQTNEDYGAKGFFVEGFTSFFSSPLVWDETLLEGEDRDVFDISIGLSLGKKWINTAGFVFEFKLGAGRNLLGNAELGLLLKGDFYVGYRF